MARTQRKDTKFPLWLHPGGQWCKKHRGKFYYFGVDKEAALKEYTAKWDDIKAGRTPRAAYDSISVGKLANLFLDAKRKRLTSGELSARTFSEYHSVCSEVVASFAAGSKVANLRAEDFSKLRGDAAKRLGPVALGNFIQRVRTVFKYGFEAALIEVPVRFGPDFAKPSRRTIRIAKADKGPKLVDAATIHKLVSEAGAPLEAMILLAINGGFGQTDCSELPQAALARSGWIDFRRPKTGMPRRFPLWPETVKAIELATMDRPAAADPAHDGLVFLTRFGRPFVRFKDGGTEKAGYPNDEIGKQFKKLLRRLKITIPGGFYTLRHTFRTVADGAKDQAAAGLIMGHVDESMAAVYRETIEDERLNAVTDHVRAWLMAGKPKRDGK